MDIDSVEDFLRDTSFTRSLLILKEIGEKLHLFHKTILNW